MGETAAGGSFGSTIGSTLESVFNRGWFLTRLEKGLSLRHIFFTMIVDRLQQIELEYLQIRGSAGV